MKTVYADLHIHIGGTTRNRPVKITASPALRFDAIIKECLEIKGMDLIGIVDCASPGVLMDIRELIKSGELMELPEGGLLHRDRVTVILGCELETVEEEGGACHLVSFFPFLAQISEFSNLMSSYVTNMELSSQRASLQAGELYDVVRRCGGIMMPAHVFTPHKGAYGNVTDRMAKLFGINDFKSISAVELGLSADTFIADHIFELSEKTFLSNSDAHSLPKIAREYNVFELEKVNFREMVLAFNRSSGRRVVTNYGMDPKLGRYHRSFCNKCSKVVEDPPPVLSCPDCGAVSPNFVTGVYDRVVQIQDNPGAVHPDHRPPYHYQIPLHFVPGLNEKFYSRLIECFGSEMAVLHKATPEELLFAVGRDIAKDIVMAREGRLELASGGGGRYGIPVTNRTTSS